MARVPRKRWAPIDGSDPEGMGAWVLRYLEDLKVKNLSPATVFNREVSLRGFLAWAGERGLARPQDVTRPILQRYQRHLYLYRKTNGKPLSFRSQRNHLQALRGWFQWLTRQNLLLYNPASDLEMPRLGKSLPQHVLGAKEVEAILGVPDLDAPLGLRDRAILETLYSTGIRRAELVALQVFDLDEARGTLRVRQGKGRRDRVVPIGERALAWVAKYIEEERPELVVEPDPGWLFLSPLGGPMAPKPLGTRVRRYVERSGIQKKGSCHLFRHACATLMLENGADIRFIQEMLGHAELAATEIYTRVSIGKLKEIHSATHPGARLARPEPPGQGPPGREPAEPSAEDLGEVLAQEQAAEEAEEPGEDLAEGGPEGRDIKTAQGPAPPTRPAQDGPGSHRGHRGRRWRRG